MTCGATALRHLRTAEQIATHPRSGCRRREGHRRRIGYVLVSGVMIFFFFWRVSTSTNENDLERRTFLVAFLRTGSSSEELTANLREKRKRLRFCDERVSRRENVNEAIKFRTRTLKVDWYFSPQ